MKENQVENVNWDAPTTKFGMEKYVYVLKALQDIIMYADNVQLEAQLIVTKLPVYAPMPIKYLMQLNFHVKIAKPIQFLTPTKLYVFVMLAMFWMEQPALLAAKIYKF